MDSESINWNDPAREARPAPNTTCPHRGRLTAFRPVSPIPRGYTAVKPQDCYAHAGGIGESKNAIPSTGETWGTELWLRRCEHNSLYSTSVRMQLMAGQGAPSKTQIKAPGHPKASPNKDN